MRLLLVVAGMVLATGRAHAQYADPPTPGHVCVRGARTYTCPDGTVLDVCDSCPGGSGGSSSSSSYDPSKPPPPTQGFLVGAIGGLGYQRKDSNGDPNKSYTAGIDVGVALGGKPGFSLTGIIGARYMAVANKMTLMTDTGWIVPLTLGIDLKPRLSYHARLDLGGTVGVEFPAVCGICGFDATADVHFGMEIYRRSTGFAYYIVKQFGGGGGQLDPPAILLRLAIVTRRLELSW